MNLSKAGHPSDRTALSLIRQDYEHCLRRAREERGGGPSHHFWINRRDHLEKILLILKHHKLGRH